MIKNRKNLFFLLFFLNSCAGSAIPSMVGNAFFSEKGFYKTIDDGLIYTKIKANILSLGLKTFGDIGIHVFNGKVLLVGNVSDSSERFKIVRMAWGNASVVEVINEIEINNDYSLIKKAKDLYLEAKINSYLLLKKKIIFNNYSIQVYRRNIYVIGISRNLEEKIEIEEFLHSFEQCDKVFNFIEINK